MASSEEEKARAMAYHWANRERLLPKMREYSRKRQTERKEELNAAKRAARAANPTPYREYDKAKRQKPEYRARVKAYHSRWRAANREKLRQQANARRAANKSAYNGRTKKSRRAQRERVLAHYGGKCACCSIATYEFLAIDHMNNDGNVHRRTLGHLTVYQWLERNNYPEGFQVLCHNCNMAKGLYGKCPHAK